MASTRFERWGGPGGSGASLTPRTVGIVGMGVIGRAVARALADGIPGLALGGVTVRDAARAEKHHCRILVPSGAIAGLDGIRGAREGRLDRVTMETRKPPRGLAGAPWIEAQRIDLDTITEETLVFEGPASEAVRAFPANVNVVAAVSLAGVGPERTRIRVLAVPGQTRNQHRVVAEGEFGRLVIEIEIVPSENPRTGKLSYLSTIAMLRELGAATRVGT